MVKILLLIFISIRISNVFAAESFVVGLDQASIRKMPSYLAPVVGIAKYGSSFQTIESKYGWYKVSAGKTTGWIHNSALGKASSILRDIGKGEAVSQEQYKDEVAAAGKGFSPEYEALYKKNNPNLSYAEIDRLEKRKVETNHIIDFMTVGQLNSQLLKVQK